MSRPPAGLPADDEPFEPTGKWANPAIYAVNWRTILLVDAGLGVVVTLVGIAVMVLWNLFVGSFVAALGLTYVTAVGRRYLQWRWLRRRAGLDP
jgi:hypothetical protein